MFDNLDVGYKTDSTSVALVCRIVESLLGGQTVHAALATGVVIANWGMAHTGNFPEAFLGEHAGLAHNDSKREQYHAI